ncbi:MAG: hypothetical protein AVDCRST_MAG58-566, partial [uncultured Rubrobacteraceae bacterium]
WRSSSPTTAGRPSTTSPSSSSRTAKCGATPA